VSPTGPDTPRGPSADDIAALGAYAQTLADGVEAAIGPWVERSVAQVHAASTGRVLPDGLRERAAVAGRDAAAAVGPRVRTLLALDIDDQRTGPLDCVREAVPWPTAVLRDAGVPSVERDAFAVKMFPDDAYDLTPASFADLDPGLLEPGLMWGAAKSHVHLARRRAAGQR
jgi:hypothetical protein